MGLKPEYRLSANQRDITDIIRDRFQSLSFTDEAGLAADTLTVTLADDRPDEPIEIPSTGAELELFLGYDGQLDRMGLFVVDEVELSGWPGIMTISAKAAPFEKSTGGKNTLQSQKTRSWKRGTTLGDMVAKIAGDHGLQPACAPSLRGISLPHIDQSDESDMHLLVRVGKKYDAVVKPADGKLVLAKHGEGKSASGKALSPVTVTGAETTAYSLKLSRKEASGKVVAAWHATKKAKRQVVEMGEGEPVRRIRTQFSTREQAVAAVRAELDKRQRAEETVTFDGPGRTDLLAEVPLTLSGFRGGVDGNWTIKRATHALDSTAGYTTNVEAEKSNGGGDHALTEKEE
jgi:uncharacterized protein